MNKSNIYIYIYIYMSIISYEIPGPSNRDNQTVVELWIVGTGGACTCSDQCEGLSGDASYPLNCGNGICEDGGPGHQLGSYLFPLGDDCTDCGSSQRTQLNPGAHCPCSATCLNGGVCNMPVSDDCTCAGGYSGKWCWKLGDCGDGGRVEGVEECDDGNNVDGDGCDANCYIETGFECVVTSGADDCTTICGDSLWLGSEGCDDGNTVPGDGCDETCQVENGWECPDGASCSELDCYPSCESSGSDAECGDGTRAFSEDCDDGNNVDGDGCSAECETEAGYTCHGSLPDTCNSDCDPVCLNHNECSAGICLCEDGYYGTDCGQEKCGDGHHTSGEGCDDGNGLDFDGCNIICEVELGYECSNGNGGVSGCSSKCGDGYNLGESCDDGNLVDGDGCSSECLVEDSWTCAGGDWKQKDQCFLNVVCGDGLLAYGESCDDGNLDEGDGCNADCEVELGWGCEYPNDCTFIPCTFECMNGATCLNPVQDVCECTFGWHGDRCNTVDDCSVACDEQHGRCWMPYLDICVCEEGYEGSDCSIVSDCTTACENDGICMMPEHDHCFCPDGFYGHDCSETVEPSDDHDGCAFLVDPCNGGLCYDRIYADFWCECPPSYSGDTCLDLPCSQDLCADSTAECVDIELEV